MADLKVKGIPPVQTARLVEEGQRHLQIKGGMGSQLAEDLRVIAVAGQGGRVIASCQ
ncbi:MAG: hypothetical protein OHK0012_25400 [Synechococcales cyanobacterium]